MKRVLSALLMLAMLLAASACESVDDSQIYGSDAEITKADSHSSSLSVYRNDVENTLEMYARDFVGAQTLWTYDADDDGDVAISYSLSVPSDGKAKLVLVAPDDTVSVLAERTVDPETEELQSKTISLMKGKNRIKIVGYDNPTLSLVLSAEVGEIYDPD